MSRHAEAIRAAFAAGYRVDSFGVVRSPKGSELKGRRLSRRTLSDNEARQLVERSRSGSKGAALAREFSVRESTVSEILSGKLYSEVTGIPFAPRKAVSQ